MPWNIKNKNAILNSYVGAKILIYKFFKVYSDGFEPVISEVNMMEISHSGIMDHKLKSWFMKELNVPGKKKYIYIHSQMISIIDNIISAMSRRIFAGFKNPLNPTKPMGFVESQSSDEIIWHTIWDKVKFIA